jgi:hypothetical protein
VLWWELALAGQKPKFGAECKIAAWLADSRELALAGQKPKFGAECKIAAWLAGSR